LLAGNKRFAANQVTAIEHDLTILKEPTVTKHEPFAAVPSGADSRVPSELIFEDASAT
jgi:carbonic anhydrase